MLPAALRLDILSRDTASLEHSNMHTFIRISRDDLPAGELLIGTDTDIAIDQFIHELALAYPKARHCVVRGMDVVADVVSGDAE